MTVPVYLLHAAADNVIPPSEALWLSHEIPKKAIREVLISPAILHADIPEEISILEKWKLLHFLARILNKLEELDIWSADRLRYRSNTIIFRKYFKLV